MRDVRVDITGTTDANGNASLVIPVPFTGAWYTVKFPLSLPAAAEWAILVSGTPLTYGRGRRVTLGPELIRDGEKVTVTVTGGPPNATIIGSMNGSAGTPEEMLVNFTPAPNTIALDVALRPILIGTFVAVGAGVSTKIFPIPPGMASIGFASERTAPNVVPTATLSGVQTGILYVSQADPAGLPVPSILDPQDTQVQLAASPGGGNQSTTDVLAWPEASAVAIQQQPGTFLRSELVDTTNNPVNVVAGVGGTRLLSVDERNATPAPWQSPNNSTIIDFTLNASTQVLVAAVAGQQVFLHGWTAAFNALAAATVILEDTASGETFDVWNNVGTVGPFRGDGKGVATVVGRGVQIRNPFAVATTVRGGLQFTQQ